MARPIEPTPILSGTDAASLRSDLRNVCSAQEAQRRIQNAQTLWAAMQPKSRGEARGR